MFITPRMGLEPGISRADRGRSRQPVASTTARACSSLLPPGPVSWSVPGPAQPVTWVPSTSCAPARSAVRAHLAA